MTKESSLVLGGSKLDMQRPEGEWDQSWACAVLSRASIRSWWRHYWKEANEGVLNGFGSADMRPGRAIGASGFRARLAPPRLALLSNSVGRWRRRRSVGWSVDAGARSCRRLATTAAVRETGRCPSSQTTLHKRTLVRRRAHRETNGSHRRRRVNSRESFGFFLRPIASVCSSLVWTRYQARPCRHGHGPNAIVDRFSWIVFAAGIFRSCSMCSAVSQVTIPNPWGFAWTLNWSVSEHMDCSTSEPLGLLENLGTG